MNIDPRWFDFGFAQPWWLLAGLVLCAGAVALFIWSWKIRKQKLSLFAAPHLLPMLTSSVSTTLRVTKLAMLVAALALLVITLARPYWGYEWKEVRRRGIDILIALDTSRSMLADDLRPNRLERSKLAITDLLNNLQGDRVGLIAFAGRSFLQCPLTLDYAAFQQSLNSVQVGIIPRGGTDLAVAINEAQAALTDTQEHNHKILVLITDGEDLEGRALNMARDAASAGLTIYTVGVGTESGAVIPIPRRNGTTDFVRDGNNQIVRSKLDESTLRTIAETTGGVFERLGSNGRGLEAIYENHLSKLTKSELKSDVQRVFYEQFQWPLALGMLLLMIEMMLPERRRQKTDTSESSDIRPTHTIRTRHTSKPSRVRSKGSFSREKNELAASSRNDLTNDQNLRN